MSGNEIRVFDHSKGVMIMVHRNSADFTSAQKVAITDRTNKLKDEILRILEQPDVTDDQTTWGYGP